MPQIASKWLADTMLKVFSSHVHQCTVQLAEYKTDRLKLLRFQADSLKDTKWWPGMEVEFRVSDTEFRYYTACDWNAEEGFVDILVYLHQQGPGSHLMDELSPGDTIALLGPGGKFLLGLAWQEYVFLGDETAIGLFLAFQHCLLYRMTFTGAIECSDESLPASVGLELKGVRTASGERGATLLEWIDATPLSTTNCIYYLAGNAHTNKLLREKLKSMGVSPALIRAKAYWMEGKKGL
jgi:NADPH-dependent ferric siderophore reductase